MSGAHASPPGLLRRYTAWSLDMTLVAAVALLACADRIGDGGARAGDAMERLAAAMAQSMFDLLAQGGSPLDLARQWLADPRHHALVTDLSSAISQAVMPPLLLACALALAWFAGWEASPRQATPGKRMLGLRVCGSGDARVGLARAAVRHLAGTLSWLTLNVGHLLALAPPRHQALHDRIAATRVLQVAGPAPLPAWAAAWLALQCLVAFAAVAWGFVAMQSAMERALGALL